MIKDKVTTQQTLFTYTTLGKLVDFKDNTLPIVEINDGYTTEIKPAHSCVKLSLQQLGSKVVLVIAENESMPVITGVIESEPVQIVRDTSVQSLSENVIKVDGKIIRLKAEESISIECGKTKITLTKEGKISLKGKYILSRAKKTNRIQGGQVGLN